jgi:hypothetical protein
MCLLEEKGAVWIAGAALLCRPREGFIRLGRQPGFPLAVLAFKSNYEDDMAVVQLHSTVDRV